MDVDIEDERLPKYWLGTAVGLILTAITLAYLFPIRFYNQFIWKYFWGPIVADAHGQQQVARSGSQTVIEGSAMDGSVFAEPGYTVVSTVSYALILVFGLFGVMLLINKLDYNLSIDTCIAFVPFMAFGGILRTVEDVNVFIFSSTGDFFIPFPFSSLIISPIIYFVLFGLGISVLLICERLESKDIVNNSDLAVAGFGVLFCLSVTTWLGYTSLVVEEISANLLVPFSTLALATTISSAIYYVIRRYSRISESVGVVGLLLIWSHMVDAFANVLSLDWSSQIGISGTYESKHVINSLIRTTTEYIQPEWLSDSIGITWPFIVLKASVAVFLIWAFDDDFMDDSPNLSIIMLLTAMAVGLGPGTRDFMRAMLGV